MRERLRIVALILLLLGLLWYLLPLFLPAGWDITQRPPRSEEPMILDQPPISFISVPVTLPLAEIERLANEEIPKVLTDKHERKRWKTRVLGIKMSTSANIRTYVERTGPVRIAGRGERLRMAIPIFFKARAKLRGAIRPSVSTDGNLTVFADLLLGFTEDWQPRVDVDPSFEWSEKPEIDLGPFDVRISDLVGDELEDLLEDKAQDLEEDAREELAIIKEAEEEWAELHEPRELSDDPPVWLRIDPQEVFLKPIRSDQENVYLGFGITARLSTSVGPKPEPSPLKPLPPLRQDLPAEQGFAIHLPVFAGYKDIDEELNENYVGRAIELGQGGALTPSNFEVYASAGNLVLGVSFAARTPGRILDTRGTVYLTGKPVFDQETEELRIENFRFTRLVDNPLVRTATWVLQDTLREELKQRLVFNLAEQVADAKTDLNEYLNQPLDEHFALRGNIEKLTITDIQPHSQGLAIDLLAAGELEVLGAAAALQQAATAPPTPPDGS